MEAKLIHGEGDKFGEPYRLLPWQRLFLWCWYELDPDPTSTFTWWYQEALIGAERGAVKTEFLAAIAMLEFAGPKEFRRNTPIIHLAAAGYEQAAETFGQCQIMCGGQAGTVPQAPLHGLFNVFDNEITFKDGRPGKIARIAAVAGTNEGGKTTLFGADELHEWLGRKARVFTVIQAALTKRMNPGRSIAISTAGVGRGTIPARPTDPLLWRMYARGILQRGNPKSRFLFDWVEFDPNLDLKKPDELRQALRGMRCADVTWSVEVRARELEEGKMPLHEFLRYFGNTFVETAADHWLIEHPGSWGNCADPKAKIPKQGDVVVGIDMALKHDAVGIIVAHRRKSDSKVIWEPHHWVADASGRIDHLAIVDFIADELGKKYTIESIVYDPRFFEIPARLLEDKGFNLVTFDQTPARLIPADGHLFELVVAGELAHPDDLILNEHSNNAAWRERETGRMLSKSLSAGHMDLIRAGSMATWELEQLEQQSALIYAY